MIVGSVFKVFKFLFKLIKFFFDLWNGFFIIFNVFFVLITLIYHEFKLFSTVYRKINRLPDKGFS